MAVMHYTNNISRTYSNSRCTIFLLSHYLRYEGGLIIIVIIIIIMTLELLQFIIDNNTTTQTGNRYRSHPIV